MPPGIQPPLILRYSASNVPILQLGIGSKTLSEQQIYDLGTNFLRVQLATIQGASIPLPYGGKPRQIMVDLDLQALQAKGLSALDVSGAINAQNLLLPAGNVKMGEREYTVRLNSSPDTVAELNDLPIKYVNGGMVYIRDVAQVRDGYAVQSNIVNQDGRRSTLVTILKSGGASTLDIVRRVKAALPRIQATLPPELDLQLLFDQSLFVRAAVEGVMKEAVIAAGLTAAMILLFLGSWRSTVIVAVSIPLSILTSIIIMKLFGQTLNTMTLGGLGLAVGILVDDATVEIENIHRNLAQGKEIEPAILDGAAQIAVPAFVSTLAICIVFVPVVFLSGAAKSLFTPLGMAVVFAMLASYLLSRTLVPTMVKFLLASEVEMYQDHEQGNHEAQPAKANWIWRIHYRFNDVFEWFRSRYRAALDWALGHAGFALGCFAAFIALSACLIPFIGQDFFPSVDAGTFRLHVRTAPGTRIEEVEHIFTQVEATIREVVPASELSMVLDDIGIPSGSFNLAFGDGSLTDVQDGEILVALTEKHHPTPAYRERLRDVLHQRFPDVTFYFQASDIVNQILNFGLPAPIDIQISGRQFYQNYALAQKIRQDVAGVPGATDVHINQVVYSPELRVNVDRSRAQTLGLTEGSVANSMLYALAGSGQATPNYWLNPQNGVNYSVVVQTPQYKIDSVDAVKNIPVTGGLGSAVAQGNAGIPPQLLNNLAQVEHTTSPAVTNHYNVQPVFDVFVNVRQRDLGGVSIDIDRILDKYRKQLPPGVQLTVRGQVTSMHESFTGLGLGMIFAVLLVYLLMVINFQSWLDPFIILTALPGAACGILWMLFLSGTTFSVPSLMGAIMTVGVATANSILMVTFANDQRSAGMNALEAASSAGATRLRPVLMTALAMIIGMLPMSLGMGEGGEQNAPLGRAVIGGLLLATVTTLLIVPIIYSRLRKEAPSGMQMEEVPE
jgi:multidrug efflux pump subunit AcrB